MNNRACSRSGFQDHGNKTSSHPALSVFLTTSKRMLVHARAKHTHIAEKALMEITAGRQRALSRVLGLVGRHPKPSEIDARGGVHVPPLPPRDIWWLRETVE